MQKKIFSYENFAITSKKTIFKKRLYNIKYVTFFNDFNNFDYNIIRTKYNLQLLQIKIKKNFLYKNFVIISKKKTIFEKRLYNF